MPADQSQFRAALLDPDHPVPPGLTNGSGQPTTKRFNVYRNNVTVALTEALRSAFPILAKLIGTENFDHLARLFARTHPPTSPLMMHYGVEMPTFLDGFAPLAHIGYLSDVARLELAMRRSYHAADATPFDATRLGSVAPEVLMASRLHLAPSVQLIPSAWPLYDIWRFNTVSGADKPRAIAQPVLITRAEFDPVPHGITPAQAAWISATMNDATLANAQDAASALAPDFDLSALLTLLIQHGGITDFTTPKD
ncbi:putative DNA-binding domain-containing protein [Tateyamaria sp. SN3-11]|uniref:HvfC/BufC family peptide modification chaperone n=1 Tax=Tateyamaria sp. SN3-11 TaxID=3092147 RepID=UPI0039E9C8F0